MNPKSRALLVPSLMVILLAAGLTQSGNAQFAPLCWSSAATSTVINTPDLGSAFQNGPTLTINGSAVPAGFSGRLSISGIFQDPGTVPLFKLLNARYRDNGTESQITLELREVNIFTGVATTLATFDSNAFPPNSGYQTSGVATACVLNGGFDFANKMYFINVRVDKTGPNGNPGLWMIQVCASSC
jgi:ABC-type phosphate transport system substrate-binding protein